MNEKKLNWLISLSRPKKQLMMIFLDIILIEISLIASYILQNAKLQLPDQVISSIFLFSPPIAIIIFYLFGLYSSVIRFLGLKAFLFIIYSVLSYSIVLFFTLNSLGLTIPNLVLIYHENGILLDASKYFSGNLVFIIINSIILLLLTSASRLLVRQVFWSFKNGIINYSNTRKKILIFGAGEAGIQLATALNFSRELLPVGFIDESSSLIGKNVLNIKIYGMADIEKLIIKYAISEILIAIPSIKIINKQRIIDELAKFPVRVSVLPSINQLAQQKFIISDRSPINIEDVLGRQSVAPNKLLMEVNIKNKNVLVTGAGGSIGSEICREIFRYKPKKIILFEQNEFSLFKVENELLDNTKIHPSRIVSILGNICDYNKINFVCKNYEIDTVFHAAAFKHVPLVEFNVVEAFKNNVIGTLNCLKAATDNNVKKFVLISSDKAVRPTSIMGATKRVSELLVQALDVSIHKKNTSFTIVRFGNVLGSSGSVLPIFKKQIEARETVFVTHENITRYFMTIKEAAQLVIQAGSLSASGIIFILDMGKPVKILDLAKKMIELSGLKWKLNRKDDGDILIKICGLRPGEKLFEELTIGNKTEETKHPKIKSITEDFIEWKKINKIINEFSYTFSEQNIKKTKQILKKAVPEFNYKIR